MSLDNDALHAVSAPAPMVHFDSELLQRYDRPLPRYTSYPTAPQFSTNFGATEFAQAMAQSNGDPIPPPLSLYLHVPYCFSPCFYCGCNRIISRDQGKAEPYVQRLLSEARLLAAHIDEDRQVQQIHLGGGTPNFLRSDQLAQLLSGLSECFQLSTAEDRDFSIELDPRHVQPQDLNALADMGFNRVSFGIQDFDPAVQLEINRVQSSEDCLNLIASCRPAGLASVNVDLVYGLPRQTLAGFERTLEQIIKVRPHRLAIYAYAHMPNLFKAQKQIDATTLPTGAAKLALLELAIARLTAAGYCYIGMDHFALPDDPLAIALQRGDLHRNFMGYSTLGDCDLLGLGVSSISQVGDCYSQNPRELRGWESSVDEGRLPAWRGLRLDGDDCLRAELIQQLMCTGSIDEAHIEDRYCIDFNAYFSKEMGRLQPLIADGLVEVHGAHIRATARGRLLLRPIAACFDRYLHG
jgi:oxygen-independent coproporphyrinogen-3 oxidase